MCARTVFTGVLAALVAVLLCAAPAGAGEASVGKPECDNSTSHGRCSVTAAYRAAPGEVNDVTVDAAPLAGSSQVRVRFTDAGAPVRAGSGCTAVDDHTSECTFYPADDLFIVAAGGDLNDRLVVSHGAGSVLLDGGEGDDVLQGSEQGETLAGGPGTDALTAGAGNDTLRDGGNGEMDVMSGGDGRDTVSYAGRTDGVTIDLSQSRGGRTGENDRLDGIENGIGGSASDTLSGDGGDNALDGGSGDDVIDGGDGADKLVGWKGDDVLRGSRGKDDLEGDQGRDRLDGGPDNDRLNPDDDYLPDDGDPDSVACGDGVDTAREVTTQDLVVPGCERAAFYDRLDRFALNLPLPSTRSAVGSVRSPECVGRGCATEVRLVIAKGERGAGTVIGATRWRAGHVRPLRLSATGRSMLTRRHHLAVVLRLTDWISRYEQESVGFRTTLELAQVAGGSA